MTSPGPQYAPTAARNTMIQGLLAAVVVGVCTGGLQAIGAGHFTLATIETSVATSVIASVLAYVQHAYAAPYLAIRKQVRGARK